MPKSSEIHLALVDAVNEAKTPEEHQIAEATLRGFRQGVPYWDWADADFHTMEKYGEDRPMCCGVLLDWKPATPVAPCSVQGESVYQHCV